jgi:hypothetical protein
MKRQTIELRFLSDRFLKWVKINFTLTPIILTPIIFTLSVCCVTLFCHSFDA